MGGGGDHRHGLLHHAATDHPAPGRPDRGPPLSNTLISLVKDTSLASVVLVTELLRVAQVAAAPTFQFFALYGVAAIYYWLICLVLSFGQHRLETRLGRFVPR